MVFYKKFKNGLRLIIDKNDSVYSVSTGVMVKTGSVNESASENGISHFIEHTVFKGTKKRSSFEISDYIDRIGAQINAYTSKETTCYYTKSTSEYFNETLEVLSDIYFNATFNSDELEKEKGVIIEEIKMYEDSPEDLCMDMLSESHFGNNGLGRTILGPEKNIKRFSIEDIKKYMDKYYTADNTVISISGKVDVDKAVKEVEKLFVNNFTRLKCKAQKVTKPPIYKDSCKSKKIEQAHIAISFKGVNRADKRNDALAIANLILGGGMSSRLYQKIREEMGLCYNIYSYNSSYKDCGVIEIYAGVNIENRDKAFKEIINEIETFSKSGITDNEFLRGKEQIKSAFIFGRESTTTQMLLYGKNLLLLDEQLDYDKKLKELEEVTKEDVEKVIKEFYTLSNYATATVGTCKTCLR